MAMACLFVAAKIEEDCRKIRDVVNVFHHLRQKRTGRYVLNVLFYIEVWRLYTASCCDDTTLWYTPIIMSTFYWLLEMPIFLEGSLQWFLGLYSVSLT